MRLEDLGIIGNCQYSALIDRAGAVVWCCLPRFDSEPVFAALLDETSGGRFLVGPAGGEEGSQSYLKNTNVLETIFRTETGTLRILDFAPRFELYGRTFRPTQLIRIVEPVAGTPRITVRCEPRTGWSKRSAPAVAGSHHLEFDGFASPLRLTTDIPISYLSGQPFAISERRHLVLTWGAPIEEPLPALCERFLNETLRYWRRWVKECEVPPAYQHEVIRSALALKLHCFEDTGAIVASTTTSIPEAPGSGRTWDYRYCWLRDAYYVLSAFRMLGHFEEREAFVRFLITIASSTPQLDLAPLYRIDGRTDLDERVLADWPGFNRDGPVRVGNAAALQRQHDVFGEMVLALSPVFLDERFSADRTPSTLALLNRLTEKAILVAGTPDAGIWEKRSSPARQSFSTLMCWAAADRMANVAERHLAESAAGFRAAAARIREDLIVHSWSVPHASFVSTFGGEDLDAALLQMVSLRLLPPDDRRVESTIDAIRRELGRDGWIMRYRVADGLGSPTATFVLCTFWLIEALAMTNRVEEARALLDRVIASMSGLGLLSEDYDVERGCLSGNFPQAYSHVGLIHAAFAASPRWHDVL